MPRDSSGAYSLPSGNPVVDGTVIESAWANPTMADIAVQMNNVLTRDGLLGPIQPMLFVNGTLGLPGIAFQESPSTGLYRVPPNTVAMAIAGVQRQRWDPTGAAITGTLGVSADLNVGGNFGLVGNAGITGNVTVGGNLVFSGVGAFGVNPGTVNQPGLFFKHDNNTGFWSQAPAYINFAIAGVSHGYLDNTGRWVIEPSSTAASPSLVVKAGVQGYAQDILGPGFATDPSILRFLNNGYTIERMRLQVDNVAGVFGTIAAIPLQIFVANNLRLQFSADGAVANFTTTAVQGFNFYVGTGPTSAGTFGISGSQGAAMVTWGNTSPGGGSMDLAVGGGTAVHINNVSPIANYFAITAAAAGGSLSINAAGSDANINMNFITKGSGGYIFYSNFGAAQPQFVISSFAGANNYIIVGGGIVGGQAPQIGASSGAMAISSPWYNSQGARPPVLSPSNYTYSYGNAFGHHISWSGAPSTNNKTHEWYLDPAGNGLLGYWIKEDLSAALQWIQVVGGFGSGTTDVNFSLGTGGSSTLTFRMTGSPAGIPGSAGFGQAQPIFQLQVAGITQTTQGWGNGAARQGTLALMDTAFNAGGGGTLTFHGWNASTPFAAIKGCLTDAAGFTAGQLILSLRNLAADTGTSPVLKLNPNGLILTDYADRELAIKLWPLAGQPANNKIGAGGTQPANQVFNMSGGASLETAAQGSICQMVNTATATSIALTRGAGMTIVAAGVAPPTGTPANIFVPPRGQAFMYWVNPTYVMVWGTGLTWS